MKDLYWLAGILEGEGCFRNQGGNCPVVVVRMTDRDVVERVAALMGSTVDEYVSNLDRSNRKDLYSTRIASRKAAGWMMTLYPLMGQRRQERIREVLSAWISAPSFRGPYGLARHLPKETKAA